ncbi:hypothetical protein BX070DRAFT_85149 [Coemansia spiralis]|nr:hypothetical protein BX070DRAFT_85149 [Coemansia spiralis]
MIAIFLTQQSTIFTLRQSVAMNIQCVAQIGEERFVIPPVLTKPKNYNSWSAKMDDTFVFDVTRQFTFNLGVYGTHPSPQRVKPSNPLASRVSFVSRRNNSIARHSLALPNDSNPSLLSNSSTRTTAKIKRGLRKIFRNKNGNESAADDPAYAGYSVPVTPAAMDSSSSFNRNSTLMPVGECSALMFDNDDVQTEQTIDESGRHIEVQKHAAPVHNNGSNPDFGGPSGFVGSYPAAAAAAAAGAMGGIPALHQEPSVPQNLFHQHPAFSRLSSYLPRSRTNTTTSAHEINYNGPRLRAFSNASTISSTPQPLGELFLDFKVDRREKRRATFTLPVVNQDQVAMRGGSHVEMAVVLEYGIIVHETCEERAVRLQKEREREQVDQQHERRQRLERQWAEIDEQDKMPRIRGNLSVFTRSGRVSTWKRYWAVLSCSRILFYESEGDEERGVQPVAKISLFHLHDAGIPTSDLVNIGPTGVELRLSPLAMTDRHRRKSAFPRKSAGGAEALVAAAARDIETHPLPGMGSLSISTNSSGLTKKREDSSATLVDEDDAMLYKFSDWQCRVYILLDTLVDRDLWLQELTQTTVPSAEFSRFRARQRKAWRTEEFESATESLRQSGKKLQVVAAQALEKMSSAHNAYAKKIFVDSVGGQRVVSMSAVGVPPPGSGVAENGGTFVVSAEDDELEGATLTSTKASAYDEQMKSKSKSKSKIVLITDNANDSDGGKFGKKNVLMVVGKPSNNSSSRAKENRGDFASAAAGNRKPVAMAFGKPATFNLVVAPANADASATLVGAAMAPAKKRLRARRRSSSVADLRRSLDTGGNSSSDESNGSAMAGARSYRRRDSGDSTVIEVVGKAMERRPGTVSRRFLFVWNVNDI